MKNILFIHNLLEESKIESFTNTIRPFLIESDKIYTPLKYSLILKGIDESKINSIKKEDLFYYLNRCDQVICGLNILEEKNQRLIKEIIQAAKDTNKNYMIVSLSEGELK